ncbi:MAG: hypothetical protein JXR37_07190 [Kiritimatiellae bacterium]|nr:hypothetical protein [Kiritimatiellia bacterium]
MKLTALLLLLGVVACCTTAEPRPTWLYSPAPGPYTVAAVPLHTLHDAARATNVQIRLTYPVASGPFPVILFGHKFGGAKDQCQALIEYGVSHGYVCIQPNHSDSCQDPSNRLTRMRILCPLPGTGRNLGGTPPGGLSTTPRPTIRFPHCGARWPW